jgi:hypothetical protein
MDDKRLLFLENSIVSICQLQDHSALQKGLEKSKDVTNFLDDPR